MARKKKAGDEFSFNFSALDYDNPQEQRREFPKLTMIPVSFDNAEALANAIEYGKNYFCFVSGSFVAGDFIEALCFTKHLNPSVLYISTLGLGKENVDSIVNIQGWLKCKKVNLIVSHYFAGAERHDVVPYMAQEFAGRNIDVAVLRSHCKITLIRSDKGDCVIAGSANLSSSNNAEQFVILHDDSICDYVQSRFDDIMQRFTIMRGSQGAEIDWKRYKEAAKTNGEEVL